MAAVTSVVLYDPRDTSPEVRTIAGFLAGYSGRTREAYTLDLRMFYRWCEEHQLTLFEITRLGRSRTSRPRRKLRVGSHQRLVRAVLPLRIEEALELEDAVGA